MATLENELEVTNRLLLDMVKNQKDSNKRMFKLYVRTIICYTILLMTMVIGFFIYEAQFESETTTTTTTITQEVSGEGSDINNIKGNQYNDNAIHNE